MYLTSYLSRLGQPFFVTFIYSICSKSITRYLQPFAVLDFFSLKYRLPSSRKRAEDFLFLFIFELFVLVFYFRFVAGKTLIYRPNSQGSKQFLLLGKRYIFSKEHTKIFCPIKCPRTLTALPNAGSCALGSAFLQKEAKSQPL